MKNIFSILSAMVIVWFAGCSSVPQIEMSFLKIQRVTYHESGKLDIRGIYTQKGYGLSKITAAARGDVIELYAAPVEKGKRRFASRITVPSHVNTVKFGERNIWVRPRAAVPEKTVAVEKKAETVKKAAPVAAPAQKEVPEVKPEPPEKSAEVKKPEVPEIITVLLINSDDFFELKPDDLSFDELFWGRALPSDNGTSAGIRKLGSRKEPVDFNVTMINGFKDLECLKIKGNIWDSCDLTGLSLPKLKKLVIDDIEVKGLDKVDLPALEEFYLNDRRSVPIGKIALPEKMEKLHTVGIQSFSGNFDYDSLKGKPIISLRIHSDFRRFDFLKGMAVEKLQLSGFTALSGSLDVLKELPLKKLIIAPYRMNDWQFLAGMKLQELDILSRTNGNFSPSLLRDMPLEKLRLRMPPQNYDQAWLECAGMPLKELVLCNAVIPTKFLFGNKNIESFAAIGCRWGFAEPPVIFSRMPNLRHLAVWQIIYQPGGQAGRIIDRQVSWGRFANRNLRSLAVASLNVGFIRQMPEITKVAIRSSEAQIVKVDGLANRRFEVFFCPDMHESAKHRLKQDMLRHNINADSTERLDLYSAW